MDRYRVFVSYSHEDKEYAKMIVEVLNENNLWPMWDEDILPGVGFSGEIKNYIAHSHVFMPFITSNSAKRNWVHQEIGFATALNVPVLPLTKDINPGELLHEIQAIRFTDNPDELKAKLANRVFRTVVANSQRNSQALYFCAEYQEERTRMMIDYAERVLTLGFTGHVRQKGGLSSFHIPNKHISHQDWKDRYGPQYREPHCELQLKERQVLQEHMEAEGCSIIVDPTLNYDHYGPKAKAARIRTLINFLESAGDERVNIVVANDTLGEDHVTIVGDWFVAEAVSAKIGKGYRHTIFTRHAPSIRTRVDRFDYELAHRLEEQHITGQDSRQVAIEKLEKTLSELN